MEAERCPKCNKILSPQERRCSNCGAKLDNNSIGKINSIYHKSNVVTLIYMAIIFIGALLYGFVNWIAAAVFVAVAIIAMFYFSLKKL